MERTLGPRDIGDIIKETFIIYKNNFWRFLAIVSVVTVPFMVIGLIFILLTGMPGQTEKLAKAASWAFLWIPLEFAGLAIFILMAGAIIYSISEHHFNRSINFRRAYNFSWHRTGAMFGAIILVFLIMFGVFLGAFLIGLLSSAATGMQESFSVFTFFVLVACAYLAIIYMWAYAGHSYNRLLY
jgi:hypothetical protein